jgi:hypothetical protein
MVKQSETGDIIRASVPTGKKQGESIGRVLVRARGFFDITTRTERIEGSPIASVPLFIVAVGTVVRKERARIPPIVSRRYSGPLSVKERSTTSC